MKAIDLWSSLACAACRFCMFRENINGEATIRCLNERCPEFEKLYAPPTYELRELVIPQVPIT